MISFKQRLIDNRLSLTRDVTHTLQVNMGFRCNQACRHCHVSAGPNRTENMDLQTTHEVARFAERGRFEVVDITGGAPELNSNLTKLIEGVRHFVPKVMLRSNLSVLDDGTRDHLIHFLKDKKVSIVASLPSINDSQTDSQRGPGIFEQSIRTLCKLNRLGYGLEGSGLELNLVSNPTGAFLSSPQSQTQERFREVLKKKWGVSFNRLLSFSNVPVGRFRQWLLQSGNLDAYMEKLALAFNPCAVEKLMCRSLVSVSWDGYLYDCDFNLAEGIHLGGRKTHVSQMAVQPEPGSSIAVSDNCYTCTAGAGFT